ncbi:TIGR00730 family Rossman fold protein [Bosea caraganae]|uniref:Cytokinin riboside 5'-monophosphate phosphoribohydrolase n=1 Tax=Bosea caraganae TaxID=2763117 RepID=A0A370L3X3_9HYPH|nr:TIGR00730 family Rossman fold protein [Bosea caraganae]RDJ23570.1 TIGR00730 family Rossman fold protein [Bosea caraganae]RDJ24386.1 TIGR00730 family Rossman fold protein [Bosea caraganae]
MRDNSAQKNSPSYRLAAQDPDFILGDSTRGARFMLEYQKAEDALRARGIVSTIVVFGSARVREGNPWYEAARAFGRLASERGGALASGEAGRYHVIATGGGPGIMEAANRGATEAGAVTIGFNITLPHEQDPNAWSTPDLTFRFHYFAMRKMHLAMRAAALVVFPGGFGTLDELFEIMTLVQTGKMPPLPIVLYDKAYWQGLIKLDAMQAAGFIRPEDLSLFRYADTPEAAYDCIVERAGDGWAPHPNGSVQT